GEPPAPPPHLVYATLTRVAEARAQTLPSAPRPTARASGRRGWWPRSDSLVAAAIVLVSLGLAVTWLAKVRQRADLIECQGNLHRYHSSLVTYADQRGDRAFPRVEEEGPCSFAGVFVPVLADAGLLEQDVSVTCPATGRRAPSAERDQVAHLEQWYVSDRG